MKPKITAASTVHISTDAPLARRFETWLAVNPRNPKNLIAASMFNGLNIVLYATFDGGQRWQRAKHGSKQEPQVTGGDPHILFDAAGVAYFGFLGRDFDVSQSADGGLTWADAALAPGRGYDRPWLAIDSKAGKLYAAGKIPVQFLEGARGPREREVIALSSSEDKGNSFRSPKLMMPGLPNEKVLQVVSDLAVLPDGKLALLYITYNFDSGELLKGNYWLLLSDDGGRNFSGPFMVAEHRAYGHAREWQSLKGLGGGRLVVDTSNTPTKGRLYVAWQDVADERFQIVVAASADGGKTWAAPMRVNDNKTASNQSNVGLAVNSQGVVGVIWNDRRDDPTDNCFRPYFAASFDGGQTFSPNVKISDDKSCTTRPDGKPREDRWVNGGDTFGFVALPDGAFQAAWINGKAGIWQLYSSVIRVEP